MPNVSAFHVILVSEVREMIPKPLLRHAGSLYSTAFCWKTKLFPIESRQKSSMRLRLLPHKDKVIVLAQMKKIR